MEQQEQIRKLSASAKYRALIDKHRRVIYLLTGIAVFSIRLLFSRHCLCARLLGTTWPAGSAISIVIWLTVLIILMSIVISGIYIWWADRFYDPEKAAIMKELSDG